MVSGCLGAQVVPSSTNTPTATPTSTRKPYPPAEKPYLDRSVTLEVNAMDSGTLSIRNAGGSDASSLINIWFNVNSQGYINPTSGQVTSQIGSTAYYSIPKNSYITITGEFPDCNAILWSGFTSTVTPAPTQTSTITPYAGAGLLSNARPDAGPGSR